ncbi:electron transport complex subunit RsxC [Buchnera aphidicola (Muscaphis stroyani)]|uniref:Ion-translocating oxidoreductase complex subunit C n=1 Tax=Buchnera aphidicola (Muscaphis stroyani) TaxID=1241869 RepID=A0A4D6Y3N1_9GAMM|nr:electron transport complex subunit RsxC [Buchnera aphidicola (Muscaphis stroyani)]
MDYSSLKKEQSNETVKNFLSFPKKFIIFIKHSLLQKNQLRVRINQKVLRGQPLSFGSETIVPVHSPASGYIKNISFFSFSENKSNEYIKIVIISDGEDKWIKLHPIKNYKKHTPEKLIRIIHKSGIIGLGGGKFPSSQKLKLSINKVHTLVINAVESEPFVTSDDCLFNNYLNEILVGCKIISWISKIKLVLIVVQENKTEIISKISSLIHNQLLFKLCLISNKYPGGSSKILIKALTDKEIPYKKHAIDIGFLVFNVATVYSIKRAVFNGEPLTERIVTFLGDKNFFHGNFWVKIGTPISYFLMHFKIQAYSDINIYLGGMLMGNKVFDLNNSTLQGQNCIFITSNKLINKKYTEYACIRCGFCSKACPINLLPQQLYWYIQSKEHDQTNKHHILDCIECKVCEQLCPSNIPLVKYFKYEKKIQHNINIENNRRNLSLVRFEKKQKRLFFNKKIFSKDDLFLKSNPILRINDFNSKKIEKTLNSFEIEENKKNKRKEIIQQAINRMKLKNK